MADAIQRERNGDLAASPVNTGAQYSPGTIALSQKVDAPASDTYDTHSGFPTYSLVSKTGYQVAVLLGRPQRIDNSLAGYESWQYEFSTAEENDDNSPPAWFVCLGTAGCQVLSVTRNFDKPQELDGLFPLAQTYSASLSIQRSPAVLRAATADAGRGTAARQGNGKTSRAHNAVDSDSPVGAEHLHAVAGGTAYRGSHAIAWLCASAGTTLLRVFFPFAAKGYGRADIVELVDEDAQCGA